MSQLLQSSIWQKSVILVIVSWSLPMETNIHQLAFLRISQTKKKMNLSDYYLAIEKTDYGSRLGFSQNIANHFSEMLNLYGFRATANSHLEFLRENVEKMS